MIIFETERLIVRHLTLADSELYFDLMNNPNVMHPIPRKTMSRTESDAHLNVILENKNEAYKEVWAIEQKENSEFIGLCAFLRNNQNQPEIGYRLREKHWRKGYGTEVTRGLLHFGFTQQNLLTITADVAASNFKSIQILEKFMQLEKEFYNNEDQCVDKRYSVSKTEWESALR